MEFSDVWNLQFKKTAEVSGHKQGNHTYCSATECPVAQRCVDNQHDLCSRETCLKRDAHHEGMHNDCQGSWCKVIKDLDENAENLSSDAYLAGLYTDEDPTDDNIIFSAPPTK